MPTADLRSEFSGPAVDLPRWLAELHRQTEVDRVLTLHIQISGPAPEVAIDELLVGAGFEADGDSPSGATWTGRRVHTLADWVGPNMEALIIGLNPSPASADGGVAFARPGNRFWPAMLKAGLVSVDRDPVHALTKHGIGFTDLVKRTTRTAAELTNDDYRSGLARLERLSAWLEPKRLIIVGLTGWRAARDRKAIAGWQETDVGGRPVYLMPNTSGLNAHTTLDGFVEHFRAGVGAKPD